MRSSRRRVTRRQQSAHESFTMSSTSRFIVSTAFTPSVKKGALALSALASAVAMTPQMARADVAAPSAEATATAPRLAQNMGQSPRVAIVQPGYSDLIKGDTSVVIAIEKGSTAVQSVEMFVDDVSATNGPIALQGMTSAKFDWQTSKLKDGQHRLVVRVTDADGLRGEADTLVYVNNSRKADKNAPTLQWKGIRSGELLHGDAQLQLDASDNFGVSYIIITVNTLDEPDRNPPLRTSIINRAPYNYPLDTTRLPDGVYVANAKAYDALGNEGKAERLTFGVTNNGLNPTILEKLDGAMDRTPAPAATKPTSSNSTRISTKISSPVDNAVRTQAPVAKPVEKVVETKAVAPRVVAKPVVSKPVPTQLTVSKPVAPKPVATKPVSTPQRVAAKPAPAKVEPTAKVTPAKSVAPRIAIRDTKPVIAPAPASITMPKLTPADAVTVTSQVAGVSAATGTVPGAEAQQKLGAPNVGVRIARSTERPHQVVESAPSMSAASGTSVFASTLQSSANIELPAVAESAIAARVSMPKAVARIAAVPQTVTPVVPKAVAPAVTTTASLQMGGTSVSELGSAPVGSGDINAALRLTSPRVAPRRIEKEVAAIPAPRVAAVQSVAKPAVPATASAATLTTAGTVVSGTAPVAESSAAAEARQRMNIHGLNAKLMASLPFGRADEAEKASPFTQKIAPRAGATITISPLTMAAMSGNKQGQIIPAMHIVKKGETLEAVAARYGMKASTLANVNGLSPKTALTVGAKLNLPRAMKIAMDGQNVGGDVGALMVGSTSVAPFRYLFEKQGGTITWDDKTQRIVASNDSHEVTITIGSREASINDQKVTMDLAAFLLSGRTMVPVRFFEKALHAQVEFEPSTGRMYVAIANDINPANQSTTR